jgi:WD40 repeat protein
VSTGKWQCKSTLRGHLFIVSCLAFKPDDPNILVSGSFDKTLKIWDLSRAACLSTVNAHSDCVNAVSWSTCGKWLVSGGDDKKINIYDAQTFQVKRSVTVDSWVQSVAFSPDGSVIAAASSIEIQLFDAQTQAKRGSPLNAHSGWVNAVAWSHCGKMLASGGDDKINIYDAQTFQVERSLTSHSGAVSSVAFSADGRWVMSGSKDKTIRLWDIHGIAQ